MYEEIIAAIKDVDRGEAKKWVIVSGIALTIYAYYKYSTWTFDTFKKLGIKGPRPWMGLGNFVGLFRRGMLKYDIEMKQKYGDVHGHFFGRQPILMIYDTVVLKQIMIKDFHLFPNHLVLDGIAPPMDKMLTVLKDDHWKHVRSIMTPTFSSGKMRKMSEQMNRCCVTLCENLKVQADNKATFDFRNLCDAFTMDAIASTAFGVTIDSHNDPNNDFVKMAAKVFKVRLSLGMVLLMLAPFLLKPLSSLGISLFDRDVINFFTQAIRRAIEQKDKQGKHMDFLQIMLNAHMEHADGDDDDDDDDGGDGGDGGDGDDDHHHHGDDGNKRKKSPTAKKGLTDDELLAQCLLFFLAGFETSSTTLSYFGYNMACNPNEQERLYDEIVEKIGDEDPTYDSIQRLTYLDMCFNETLRMFPIGSRTDRVASHDVTINGLFIPKGMVVGIPIYALHNDPDYWKDPEVFNPERFSPQNWNPSTSDPMRFMPFGGGPRGCVGMRLAKMEAKMAVVHVVRRFRFLVSEETDIPPSFEKFSIKNKNGIKIKVECR